jgi:hypothetical protein
MFTDVYSYNMNEPGPIHMIFVIDLKAYKEHKTNAQFAESFLLNDFKKM